MATHNKPKPVHGLHKRTGIGRVRLSGEYLQTSGPDGLWKHGSPEAHAEWNRLINEWRSRGEAPPSTWADHDRDPAALTVTQVLALYITDYLIPVKYDGDENAGEIQLHKTCFAIACEEPRFGNVKAKALDIEHFDALSDHLATRRLKRDSSKGLSREMRNKVTSKVKSALSKMMRKKLVTPEAVTLAKEILAQVKKGSKGVREPDGVLGPSDEEISVICKHLRDTPADLVRVLRDCGARPSEVCLLRANQIVKTKPTLWHAHLEEHKTAYKGQRRTLRFGPEAIAILAPRLLQAGKDGYLFATIHGTPYRRGNLWLALKAAATNAGVRSWGPNALRHSFVTALCRSDLDRAVISRMVGHSGEAMLGHYDDEKGEAEADAVMEKVG